MSDDDPIDGLRRIALATRAGPDMRALAEALRSEGRDVEAFVRSREGPPGLDRVAACERPLPMPARALRPAWR